MFTVLKNLSNLLTIGGDWYFFGLTYGWQVRNGIDGDPGEVGKGWVLLRMFPSLSYWIIMCVKLHCVIDD